MLCISYELVIFVLFHIRWMLLVESMELQMESVQEKGAIFKFKVSKYFQYVATI